MSRVSAGAGRELNLGWCARGDVVGVEFFTRGGDRPTVTEGIGKDAVSLSVLIVAEPARRDYGGMDAVFDDTCGNLINLHQD
jgi:hypothetical protein